MSCLSYHMGQEGQWSIRPSTTTTAGVRLFFLLLLCLIIATCSTTALALEPQKTTKKAAVVVGGGPVGLATALTLSNPPHSYDVTVLEQASVEQYDPTKAYLYNVNPRGQVWMKENFPKALEKLQKAGSQGSMSRITIVPADPDQPIPGIKTLGTYDTTKNNPKTEQEKKAEEEEAAANAATSTATISTIASEDEKLDNRNYWIPRHSMICVLEDEIKEQMAEREVSPERQKVQGCIVLKKSRQFSSIEPVSSSLEEGDDDGTSLLEVSVKDLETGETEVYCGNLIVAADGFTSAVRDCLADDSKKTWLQERPTKFKVKRWVSPATGLRMKVIQMPPGFAIPDSDGSMKPTENEYTYAIRGKYNGFTNYVSLGLLPVRDPNMVRPANVITRPNHEVWTLTDGPAAKKWFAEAFPRFNWDDYVNDAEWDRFAKAKGTTFPNCQYSPALQASSPDEKSGVVLVGDAAHAFPPDIGQGINAGLCDVVALDRSLRGKDLISGEDKEKPATLGAALKEYERVQVPNIAALIRISRNGFPYQYRQSLFRDRIGSFLLTMNIAFRMILNKISFGLIPPSCIVLLQNSKLTYRQVMRRCDITTVGLWTVAAFAIGLKFYGLGAVLRTAIGMS